MLITVPVFLPILQQLQIDNIHFAISILINMELAVITPSVGMNLFVISAIGDVPILRVFQGTMPFIALIGAVLLLVTYFESVALLTLRLVGGS